MPLANESLIRLHVDHAAIVEFGKRSLAVRAGLSMLAGKAVVLMKANTPVSKVQPVYARRGATVPGGQRYGGDFPLRPSGYLRNSIHSEMAPSNVMLVGSSAPYARFVNDGTRPHVIRSTGPWPLRNRATGQVFGPVVRHPGTRPVRFVERTAEAMRGSRIVL